MRPLKMPDHTYVFCQIEVVQNGVSIQDDFIGVQAYLRTFIGKEGPVPVPDDAERTLTGWEYFPPALGIAIRHTWDVAGHTPIIVTENGIATADDRRRIDYTFGAIAGMHDAMDDGCLCSM